MLRKNRWAVAVILFTLTIVLGLHDWHTGPEAKPAEDAQIDPASLIGQSEDQVREAWGEPDTIVLDMPQGDVWEYRSKHRVLCLKEGHVIRILDTTNGPMQIAP